MNGFGPYSYLVIFASLVAAGLGLPIPEEIPVVTGGALCARASARPPVDPANWAVMPMAVPVPEMLPITSAVATADFEARDNVPRPRRHPIWWLMLPVCVAGVVLSDVFLYGMGRLAGPRILDNRWVKRLVKPEKRHKIIDNLHKHGVKILLVARVTPGIRAPIFISAGVIHLPLRKFLLADGIYAIPGVTLLFTLAFWFTDAFIELVNRAVHYEKFIGPMIIVVIGAAVGGYYLHAYLNRRVETGDPGEVPIIPKIGETLSHISEHIHLPHLHHDKDGQKMPAEEKKEQPPKPPPQPEPPVAAPAQPQQRNRR